MTHSEPNAVQQALAAAGREMSAALAEAGYRIVATAALGQVIAGLPDAADGIIAAMPADQQRMLVGHATALWDLAIVHTPEGRDADTPDTDPGSQHLHDAGVLALILAGRHVAVARHLDARTPEQLATIRTAAQVLIETIDIRPRPGGAQ